MEEIVHPKGKFFYSMSEVCELFGVNASLLRFWEEEFACLKPSKNSRGHRRYTPADVDTIRLIYHLVKEQGMTIEGANKRIRQNKEGINHDAEIVERLRSIRNMLAALKAEIGTDVEVIELDEETEAFATEVAAKEPVAEEPMVEDAAVEEVAMPEVAKETATEESFVEKEEPFVEREEPFVGREEAVAEPVQEEKPKPRIIEQTLF